MSRLAALLAVLVLCACHQADGHFVVPGARADQLQVGGLAFARGDGEDWFRPHKVKRISADTVTLFDHERYSWPVPLSQVVPPSALQPGVLFDSNGPEQGMKDDSGPCERQHRLVIRSVLEGAVSATCLGQERTFPLLSVRPRWEGVERYRATQLATVLALLVAGAWCFVAVRRRVARSRGVLAATQRAARDFRLESAQRPAPGDDKSPRRRSTTAALRASRSLLVCPNCGDVVPLVGAASTPCRSCANVVAIPPDYQALVQAKEQVARQMPEAVAALRRSELVSSPLGVLLFAGLAAGVWTLQIALRQRELLGYPAGLALRLGALLLMVAAGAVVYTLLKSDLSLRGLLKPLYAPRSAKGTGYDCRACGAPLGADRDGVALCDYCQAQNLINAALAQSARVAQDEAQAVGLTLAGATAQFWAGFWRIAGAPTLFGSFGLAAVSLVLSIVFLIIFLQ